MGKADRNPQITATALLFINMYLETTHLNLRELLPRVGISADITMEPQVMVPLRSVISLYEIAAKKLNDETLGVVIGSMAPIGAPGVFDYTALSAPTLDIALKNWVRFHQMISDGFCLNYEIDGEECVLEWEFSDYYGPDAQFMGLAESFVASRLRHLVQDETISITGIFQHPQPERVNIYKKLIGEKLYFDEPKYQVRFPKYFLEFKPPGSEPNLYTLIEQAALAEIENRENRSDDLFRITQEISNAIKKGKVSVNIVAAEMGMSTRSLQRSLEVSGTTFSQLTDDIRKSMARRYLLETETPINEIAFLLGYSEPSVFSRAGKAWFGVAPKDYRKQG